MPMTDKQVTQLTARHHRQVASLKAALNSAKTNAEYVNSVLSADALSKRDLRAISVANSKILRTTTKYSA